MTNTIAATALSQRDPHRVRCTCGVYARAHAEGRGCGAYRRASVARLWLLDHSPARHVIGEAWLRLPERARWQVVSAYHKLRPALCWCDLVDAALKPSYRADYRAPWGCGCDVPLPTDARKPSGACYCPVGQAEETAK